MKKKILLVTSVIIVLVFTSLFIYNKVIYKKRTIEQITNIKFADIKYVVNDLDSNYDLNKFLNQFKNKKFTRKKNTKLISKTVAFKILCYDSNDKVICTIKCNGNGYYIIAGEFKNTGKEILYDYGID